MPRPAPFFVRVWTPDPAEEGPDDEEDTPLDTEAEARAYAKKWRRKGKNAAAFRREGIHVPEEIPIPDPPAQFWEWTDVQIDEDEIQREYERAAKRRREK